MKNWTRTLVLAMAVCFSTQVLAQSAEELEKSTQQALQDELQQLENHRVGMERHAVDVDVEMRAAESRLAEAARRIGELSSRQLQIVGSTSWNMDTDFNDRPVLGITIGAISGNGAVEGVEVMAVSPGGAAASAGLRSGDVITAVNKESLSADSGENANQKLLDFLSGVEEGDTLDVEYLRDGKVSTIEVSPQRMMTRVFEFKGPGSHFSFPSVPHAPGGPGGNFEEFIFMSGAGGWGDMEMVELTEDLGRYFGTDEGYLVISAPQQEELKLRDGDVIQSIDGREPKSVSHAIRILSSYQNGESLEIKIMRDKHRQTLKIEMPDLQSGRPEEVLAPSIESNIRVAPTRNVRPAKEST